MDHQETGAFLRACRGEPGTQVPVWFMRQAGRSLPEYRSLRGSGTILDAIRQPDLATEITLQPVRRLGVDAAVLYSDIVVPVAAIDFGIDIHPGVGPVVEHPFRSEADLGRLRPLEPADDLPYVIETVQNLVGELGDTPLIGFAGAPFTVASYLVEGQPSRTYRFTKSLMYSEPELWQRLTDRLADLALASLRAQVEAGAAAVQLFDSWAGALNRSDYERYVLPSTRKVFEGIADLAVPCIHFGVGTGELLELMADAGADVMGIDWHVQLDDARARLGDDVALQGNLDPVAVLAPWDVVAERVRDVLRRAGGHPGHIFNLGHGVLPETDPDVLARIVELVHEEARADGTVAKMVEKSQLGGAPVQPLPDRSASTTSTEHNTAISQAPAQETPAQEAPAQEAPAQEAPAQEAPAQEAPAQEAPAQEMPLRQVKPEGDIGEIGQARDSHNEATAS